MNDDTVPDENWSQRSGRLPPTADDCVIEGRSSHEEVVDWWDERFGVDPAVFDGYTFQEEGTDRIWTFHGEIVDPIEVEGLGMRILRIRQRHWKPSTNAVQCFYGGATRNVIELSPNKAQTLVDGHDQQLDRWEGDWGYLAAAHEIADELEPLGVGLYLHGELRSTIPRDRQEDLVEPE